MIKTVYDKPMIVIAANGSVGTVFLRDEPKYRIHSDTIGIIIKNNELLPDYVQYALRNAAAKAQVHSTTKLYMKRLRSLKILVPVALGYLYLSFSITLSIRV
ncbi:MAG: restriction endonuclease subunit S [Promethearchaeota archaeon]